MFNKSWRALVALNVLASTISCVDADADLELDDDGSLVVLEQSLAASRPLHGVHHWDAPRGPALVDAVAAWSGRPYELAMTYAPNSTWSALHDLGWQLPTWAKWVAAQPGRRFVYSLPMLPNGENASLASCAQGSYDAHFGAVGAALVDAGLGNAIVRLGWEFDGDWFKWSARGHEREYAGCFQRVVRAMRGARANGALQFEWSASDDIFMASPTLIRDAYPGDAYVDVLGVNAYDVSWVANSYPLPSNCDAACQRTRRANAWADLTRGMNFMRDLAVQKNKALSIPEWGLWQRSDGQGGGDNADYVARMHAFVNDPANRVLYESYFDVDYVDGAHQISDVSGTGSGAAPGHSYKTRFPNAAAKYRELFGRN
ncbi:MAG TPA: glycosyl hydrolase [Polyangiales bacterium]